MAERSAYRVTAEETGLRLDRFLKERLEGRSRAYCQRLIVEGCVEVPGAPGVAADTHVSEGQIVKVALPDERLSSLSISKEPLSILMEDPSFLVIDKPAGMVVHPGAGHAEGTLCNALLGLHPEIASAGSASRPGIVHRLDRGTSGALIVARTPGAYQDLVGQFAARTVKKIYLAIVAGRPRQASGEIDAPIARDRVHRKRFTTRGRGGREALTSYRVKETTGAYSLLEVRLHTGRTHQIRVHLTALGHPLLGDPTYGHAGRQLSEELAARAGARAGAYLHAHVIRFAHPMTHEPVRVISPVPADFSEMWRSLP